MRKVSSSGNKSTELRFRGKLAQSKIKGWEIRPKMKYSPDFIFRAKRIAIFIDGCFWHACPICKKIPSSNSEYWEKKFKRNMERDQKAKKELENDGWIVLRFWEHEISDNLDHCIETLKKHLCQWS